MSEHAIDTEYVKPKCPKCNSGNVRFRSLPEFKEHPMRCNVCGNEWKGD